MPLLSYTELLKKPQAEKGAPALFIKEIIPLSEEDIVRFFSKVNKTPEGCWLWTGGLNTSGYGQFRSNRRNNVCHRISYSLLKGKIPEGLVLDHLCRVRHCVNPDHLEPVSLRTNSLRGDTINARNASKTHCPKGHPYTPENTYLIPAYPKHPEELRRRNCKACKAEYRLKVKLSKNLVSKGVVNA